MTVVPSTVPSATSRRRSGARARDRPVRHREAGASPVRSAVAPRPASSSTRSRGGTGRRRARRSSSRSGMAPRPGTRPPPRHASYRSGRKGVRVRRSSGDTRRSYHGLSLGRCGSVLSSRFATIFWRSRKDRQRVSTSGPSPPSLHLGVWFDALDALRDAYEVVLELRESVVQRGEALVHAHALGGGTGRDRDGHAALGDGDGLRSRRRTPGRRPCLPSGSRREVSAVSSADSGSSPRSSACRSRRFVRTSSRYSLIRSAFRLPHRLPRPRAGPYSTLRPPLNPPFGYGFRPCEPSPASP